MVPSPNETTLYSNSEHLRPVYPYLSFYVLIPILSLPPQSLLSFIYLFYNDIFALMNLVSFSVWVTIIDVWPKTLSHMGLGLLTF